MTATLISIGIKSPIKSRKIKFIIFWEVLMTFFKWSVIMKIKRWKKMNTWYKNGYILFLSIDKRKQRAEYIQIMYPV